MHDQIKNCFVISPIGAEGSATRKHADVVFECIIAPACANVGEAGGACYAPERGDQKAAPGKITDQIYEDILAADLIIAVLTEHNPNVYYELAVAQSAAKPVILLLEKGFEPPFDVKDHRIIYYDFDPQAIYRGDYAELLRSAIVSLENRRSRPTVPFAPHLAPLGDPMQKVGDRTSDAEEEVIRIISQAKRFVWMMGYTLRGWSMNESYVNKLVGVVPNLDRSLQILTLGPDNPTFDASMKTPEVTASATESARNSPGRWLEIFREKQIDESKVEIRTNNSKSMGFQICMNESECISVPYLVSRDTVRSTYVYSKKGSSYYETMHEEFRYLWEKSVRYAEPNSTKKKENKKKKRR